MRNFIISVFVFGFGSIALAQTSYKEMMNDNKVNFYNVCKAAEAYFETHDKGKGSGWVGYQRWKYENESKYAPSGNRNNLNPLFVANEYSRISKEETHVLYKTDYSSGWRDLGPYRIDSISGAYSTGLGRVIASYVHKLDPNIMYVGSRSGGFWKSTDGGLHWKGTTDTLPASGVGTITAKPDNANYVLIGVQNGGNNYSHGIYKSIDGGDSWEVTNFNPIVLHKGGLGSNFKINEIKFHPRVANVVFVGASDGLYRSINNLSSWVKISGISGAVTEIDFHPTDDNIVYIYNNVGSNKNKILSSTNQGLSFTPSAILPGNNGTTGYISISSDCSDCVYYASSKGVWVSYDKAQNFKFLSNPPSACKGFTVNDLDTSKMLYGYVDVEASNDGGRTFKQVSWWSLNSSKHGGGSYQKKLANSGHYIHADLHPAISVNGVYYVGTDGFFCKSGNNGNTWKIIGQGIGTRENYCLGVSQSNHYRTMSGSQDNGTSIKHKTTWIEFYGADGMEAIIHPLNDDWMIGSIQYGGRRRTKNGGKNQSGVNAPGQAGSSFGNWIAPLAYDPNNQMHVYNFSKYIYKSENFGTNWDSIGRPNFSGTIAEAAIAENNSNIIVASRGSSIEKSIDGGKTFRSIRNNLPSSTITDIAFNPKNDENIFVTYNTYSNNGSKIYMTVNGGGSWINITYNLRNMPLRAVVVDHLNPPNIYVGAEIGVYAKPLNGTKWKLYNKGLPNSTIKELEIVNGSNSLRAAIWGRGLWEYTLIGRENYPAILRTKINDLPTDNTPRKGMEQSVMSVISYSGTLSKVFVKWSTGAPVFDQTIEMENVSDSIWKTITPLPSFSENTKVFFKVFAIGDNMDTTETYKFMYEVKPFKYCYATGNNGAGNLFINNISVADLNNTTENGGYTFHKNKLIHLKQDSSYTLSVSANTDWARNKCAAWIDYNYNANFGTIENLGMSKLVNKVSSSTFKVSKFANTNDTLRLRVRLFYYGSSEEPCGDQFGEVEDYPVVISGDNVSILPEQKLTNDMIYVYPNPNQGVFNLELKEGVEDAHLKIYNNIGDLILESNLKDEKHRRIDLTSYANGIYFIHIESKSNKGVVKIIKN